MHPRGKSIAISSAGVGVVVHAVAGWAARNLQVATRKARVGKVFEYSEPNEHILGVVINWRIS